MTRAGMPMDRARALGRRLEFWQAVGWQHSLSGNLAAELTDFLA